MTLPINLLEYEDLARTRLPKMVFDYFAGGAGDEITKAANRDDYNRIRLRYRVLRKIGQRDLSTSVFGQQLPLPIAVAPMAFQKLAHPEGEIATVRGTGKAGAIFVASTMATVTMEEIAKNASGPIWFQLYVFKDRGITKSIVQRAEAAGFTALQVTVDVPVMGRREADMRNQFHLPDSYTVANFDAPEYSGLPAEDGESGPALYTRCRFDPDLTWKDIEWFTSITRLPVLIKGIVRGDDARLALEHGASGIVVSNHGGRQLDTSPSTIRVLPEIVEAIGGKGTIVIDGGIRRGVDIVKALALGANCVQVGRPVLWGLVVDGGEGACRVLTILKEELDNVMALCGCSKIPELTPSLVMTEW
jgi:4-hydroxymandelate oxidase